MKDIFQSDCLVLINPVNTVGVMGAGLAKAFKLRYPVMNEEYISTCKSGYLHVGSVHMYQDRNKEQYICNFPSKEDWRNPSTLAIVEASAVALAQWCEKFTQTNPDTPITIAMPDVGCGLGGLKWEDVKPIIEKHLHAYGVDYLIEG